MASNNSSTNFTIEVNKALSYVENFSLLPFNNSKSRFELEFEFILTNKDWIFTHGLVYLKDLDQSDPIAKAFVNLECVQVHLQQCAIHLHYITKLHDIFVNLVKVPGFSVLSKEKLLLHDFSKQLVMEVVGYVEKFVLGGGTDYFWSLAKNHHLSNNPHHINNFVGYSKGSEIPDIFLIEAILDGLARTAEKRPYCTLFELFHHQNRWLKTFSSQSLKWFTLAKTNIAHSPYKDFYVDQ